VVRGTLRTWSGGVGVAGVVWQTPSDLSGIPTLPANH
jgi:hypothetical protein